MAGGPSTAALAAAVGEAGGLGMLAAGYRAAGRRRRGDRDAARPDAGAVRDQPVRAARAGAGCRGPGALRRAPGRGGRAPSRRGRRPAARRRRLGGEAGDRRRRARAGRLLHLRLPARRGRRGAARRRRGGLGHGHDARGGREAAAAGVDALVAQGVEAGGHRGSFDDGRPGRPRAARAPAARRAPPSSCRSSPRAASPPAASIAAVLAAGARAAQLGTVFMRTPEAATSPRTARRCGATRRRPYPCVHRRTARGIVNRFLAEHAGDAPAAYPDVHHLTAPLRAARAPAATRARSTCGRARRTRSPGGAGRRPRAAARRRGAGRAPRGRGARAP